MSGLLEAVTFTRMNGSTWQTLRVGMVMVGPDRHARFHPSVLATTRVLVTPPPPSPR